MIQKAQMTKLALAAKSRARSAPRRVAPARITPLPGIRRLRSQNCIAEFYSTGIARPNRWRPLCDAKIRLSHFVAFRQHCGRGVLGDVADFEHVAVMGGVQGHMCVL